MGAKKLDDTSSKYYFNKISGDELLNLLAIAVEKSVEIVVWLKGHEKDIQIYYPIKLEKNEGRLHLEYAPGILKPKKSDFINHPIFLKMNMDKFYIFGHGKLLFENDSYQISTSSIFYKSQQRENIRVEADPKLNLKMEIKINEEIYNINDISASGASFLIPQEKISDFEIGKILSRITIQIEDKKFKVPSIEVVKELEKTQPNFKCFAVKFLNMHIEEETQLVIKLTSLKRKIDILKSKNK